MKPYINRVMKTIEGAAKMTRFWKAENVVFIKGTLFAVYSDIDLLVPSSQPKSKNDTWGEEELTKALRQKTSSKRDSSENRDTKASKADSSKRSSDREGKRDLRTRLILVSKEVRMKY